VMLRILMMPNVHVWSCGVGGVLGGFSFRLRGAVETTTSDGTNNILSRGVVIRCWESMNDARTK
jgi:hypothetical protein